MAIDENDDLEQELEDTLKESKMSLSREELKEAIAARD